jgi:hypothetical protein
MVLQAKNRKNKLLIQTAAVKAFRPFLPLKAAQVCQERTDELAVTE